MNKSIVVKQIERVKTCPNDLSASLAYVEKARDK